MPNWIRKLFPSLTVDNAIRNKQGIIREEAIWINQKAIESHKYYLASKTDNPAITGTDTFHEGYITFYQHAINLIKTGKDSALTVAEAIKKYTIDANGHLYWANHPQGGVNTNGSAEYNMMWYWRWVAVIKFLEASP